MGRLAYEQPVRDRLPHRPVTASRESPRFRSANEYFRHMTKSNVVRCAWCGERFAVPVGPGRRPKYCRRSHRQRAYEARQVAVDRGLADGEVLVSAETWHRLRDAIYVAETTSADAMEDVLEADSGDEMLAIISRLREAIGGVVDAAGEPIALADPD